MRLPRSAGTLALPIVIAGFALGFSNSTQRPAASSFAGLYPDFVDVLPNDYAGPTFVLSQDYPTSLPSDDAPWQSIDFRLSPDEYVLAIRDYFFEGMEAVDFRAEQNEVRTWYHMPWMHVGRHPREGIHGLTRELASPPFKLDPAQSRPVQNWAVGYYNPRGGYTVGRVWADSRDPNPSEAQFPVGTVVAKLLFTAADATQVPWIEGAYEWTANIDDPSSSSGKALSTVRLLQIDLAVRDPRANVTTGWVFATLVYDRTFDGTALQRMRPVGLMWGNDPGVTPEDVASGAAVLRETLISPDAPMPARRLLGWAGRLNGPVDNPQSACLSCHSVAQHPRGSRGIAPPSDATNATRLLWFRNLKPDEPFDAGRTSLDYSLQMEVALRNYFNPTLNPGIVPEGIGAMAIGDSVSGMRVAPTPWMTSSEADRLFIPPSAIPSAPAVAE